MTNETFQKAKNIKARIIQYELILKTLKKGDWVDLIQFSSGVGNVKVRDPMEIELLCNTYKDLITKKLDIAQKEFSELC